MSATAYGRARYGAGAYGGRALPPADLSRAAMIEVVDPSGAPKAFFQTGAGVLLAVNFSLDECGCKDFSLSFSRGVNISERDRVAIRLFDGDDYFFRGVVRAVPIAGSTKREFTYGGFGLNDYLGRVLTGDLSYAGDPVAEILADLAAILTAETPVGYNPGKVVLNTDITVTGTAFHFETLKDALKTLQDIQNSDGGDYVYGVDQDGEFFFRPRSAALVTTLVVGKRGRHGITAYEPDDANEARSQLVVLRKDGTYFATYTSAEDLDVWQEKVTGPDLADADLDLWARGQLLVKERETRQATVTWEIERARPTLLVADGTLRVISQVPPVVLAPGSSLFGAGLFGAGLFGGHVYDGQLVDDTLAVKGVAYAVAAEGATRTVQLGAVPVSLDRDMIEIHKDVQALRTSLGR